jgi:hypothetical protein
MIAAFSSALIVALLLAVIGQRATLLRFRFPCVAVAQTRESGTPAMKSCAINSANPPGPWRIFAVET